MTTTWKKEVHSLFFTCNICNQYAIFSTHCRYCGHYTCTNCNHLINIDDKFSVFKCSNIPPEKKNIKKACTICLQNMILRKRVYVWMSYLKFIIEKNDINFLKKLLPLFCKKKFIKNQKIPLLLKAVALYFLKILNEVTCNSSFKYITDERLDDVIEFKHFLSSKSRQLLFFDICSRNQKFKNVKKIIKVKAKLPFILSAVTSHNDYQLSLKMVLVKKPFVQQLPSYIDLINKKTILYQELLNHIPEFISHNMKIEYKIKSHQALFLRVYSSYHKIYDCINDYKENQNLINLKDIDICFNFEIKKVKSFVLNKHMNFKNVLSINVNSENQSFILNECKFNFMKFYLFKNSSYIQYFQNSIKIYENNNEEAIICTKHNLKHLKDFYKKPTVYLESLLILLKIVILQSIFHNTAYFCSNLHYIIDNNNILLLNIFSKEQKALANDNNSQTISDKFKSLISYHFENTESIYWESRVLGFSHEDALFVARQSNITKYIPSDIVQFSEQFNLI